MVVMHCVCNMYCIYVAMVQIGGMKANETLLKQKA